MATRVPRGRSAGLIQHPRREVSTLRLILVSVSPLFFVSFTSPQTFELKNDVIDNGGTKMSSRGYILRGSFGQSTIRKISSANYITYVGFWHPYPAGPGKDLPNGVYFYRTNAEGFMETRKMVIVR